jgi:hypothetical protein
MICVIQEPICSAESIRNRAGILSRPVALEHFNSASIRTILAVAAFAKEKEFG